MVELYKYALGKTHTQLHIPAYADTHPHTEINQTNKQNGRYVSESVSMLSPSWGASLRWAHPHTHCERKQTHKTVLCIRVRLYVVAALGMLPFALPCFTFRLRLLLFCVAGRPAEQVKLVRRVKSYENGFISTPAVMSPTNTVTDLDDLKAERNISGEIDKVISAIIQFHGNPRACTGDRGGRRVCTKTYDNESWTRKS